MPYLNIDPDYFNHPKITMLVGRLGKEAENIPIKLWCHCAKYSPKDGVIATSEKDIASLCGYLGDSTALVASLIDLKIIYTSGIPVVYRVHDWAEHQGHLWALKVRNKKNAINRWKGYRKAKSDSVPVADSGSTTGIPVVCHTDAPNLTLPNLTLPSKKGERAGANFPPSFEEVSAYCKERNNNIDPEEFIDQGLKNGWVDKNGNKYKNWMAVIRNWERYAVANKRKTGVVAGMGVGYQKAGISGEDEERLRQLEEQDVLAKEGDDE